MNFDGCEASVRHQLLSEYVGYKVLQVLKLRRTRQKTNRLWPQDERHVSVRLSALTVVQLVAV